MARSARSQRRQRRQQEAGAESQPTQRTRARQQQLRPSAPPAKQQTGRHEPVQRARFIRESWAELKKVDWPSRGQVTQGTIVVIIACAIVGAYLWVLDLGMKQLVEKVIIGG